MKRLFIAVVLCVMCLVVGCSSNQEEEVINKKLVTYKIDEAFIDNPKNGSFEIIEPLWWSVDIYSDEQKYEADLSKYSTEQRYVFAISWYIAEVNNGGHDQFYYNSTGIVADDALKGLQEIGLEENYNILKESISRLKSNPSKDRTERQEQLEKSEANFDDLDGAFYETNPEIKLMEYIKANKEKFYFNGEISIPE